MVQNSFRFAVTALSTFLGYTAWNLLQNATGADSMLNIDWQILPVSWSDVGSGVVAFVATVIALGVLTDRDEKAWMVISSRRRHTRLQGDWSSDVCSSD